MEWSRLSPGNSCLQPSPVCRRNQGVFHSYNCDCSCVEYLIDSISCSDSTLQAAIGLIRANTNNMRNDFEAAATAMIEVDPYRRSQRTPGKGGATMSAIDFGAGRGNSGVDLSWHPKKEFMSLPVEQRDELSAWIKTNDGRKAIEQSRKAFKKKQRKDGGRNNEGNWKKKLKKAMHTDAGLKSVMSLLADAEKNNSAFVSALQSTLTVPSTANVYAVTPVVQFQLPPAPSVTPSATPSNAPKSTIASTIATGTFPATSIKLNSILHNGKK